MKTTLDHVLEGIHPARTFERMARRLDEAMNTFPVAVATLSNWEEYRRVLVQFCRHVEGTILGIPGRLPDSGLEYDWGKYMPVLNRALGEEGWKLGFELVRTGNEGGLRAVLGKVGQAIADGYTETWINIAVWGYWNSLSVEQHVAAADEYLAKYGHLLPSELTEGRAVRVRANLPKFLRQHPRLLQELAKAGRLAP